MRNREIRIWLNKHNQIQWKGKKVKPSEMSLMGAVLQYAAIGELGGLGIKRERRFAKNLPIPKSLKGIIVKGKTVKIGGRKNG